MSDPSIIKQRLSEFAYAIGKNKRQFTKDIGVSESFLVSKGGITEEKIINIISMFPQLNANWLLTGKGDMILSQSGDLPENELNLSENSTDKNSMGKATMEIYQRIEIIRKEFFGNNINFAKAMNEKPTTTSGWCSGTRNIGINVVQKILEKIPNISDVWLYTGKGSMLLAEGENLNENKSNLLKQTIAEERLPISSDIKEMLNQKFESMTDELGKLIMEKMSGIVEGQLELLRIQITTQSKTIESQNSVVDKVLDRITGVEQKTGKIIEMVERKIV